MVVCMKTDDPLAHQSEVELRQIAERLKIYRAPELQPAAHHRLAELFAEEGYLCTSIVLRQPQSEREQEQYEAERTRREAAHKAR